MLDKLLNIIHFFNLFYLFFHAPALSRLPWPSKTTPCTKQLHHSAWSKSLELRLHLPFGRFTSDSLLYSWKSTLCGVSCFCDMFFWPVFSFWFCCLTVCLLMVVFALATTSSGTAESTTVKRFCRKVCHAPWSSRPSARGWLMAWSWQGFRKPTAKHGQTIHSYTGTTWHIHAQTMRTNLSSSAFMHWCHSARVPILWPTLGRTHLSATPILRSRGDKVPINRAALESYSRLHHSWETKMDLPTSIQKILFNIV